MKDYSRLPKVEWGSEPGTYGGFYAFLQSQTIDNVSNFIEREGRILDAGSGNGSLAIKLAKRGYKVYCIDISDRLIAYAFKTILASNHEEKISTAICDVKKICYRDSFFDGVTSVEVLEHLQHPQDAIREFRRVLKLGGYCIVSVPANQNLWNIVDYWSRHVKRYDAQELKDLFETNGFNIEVIEYWGFPLSRFYYSYVYSTFLKKKLENPKSRSINQLIKFGLNEVVVELLYLILKFDNLFKRLPYGIGLIMVAKKVDTH